MPNEASVDTAGLLVPSSRLMLSISSSLTDVRVYQTPEANRLLQYSSVSSPVPISISEEFRHLIEILYPFVLSSSTTCVISLMRSLNITCCRAVSGNESLMCAPLFRDERTLSVSSRLDRTSSSKLLGDVAVGTTRSTSSTFRMRDGTL
jgi:hypothetical protein